MRRFAWYSPEINVIILQSLMDECLIHFEWDHRDLYNESVKCLGDYSVDPIEKYLWLPLGEL